MDQTPLAAALEKAKKTHFTGALILRRPGGESYTVTVHEGTPTRVYVGPDKLPPGVKLLPLDLVRAAMTSDVLSPQDQADAKARARQTKRRLAWIEELEGQVFEDPSLRVSPPTIPPPPFVEPQVGVGAARMSTMISGEYRRVSLPANWETQRLTPPPMPRVTPPPMQPPPPPPPQRDPSQKPPVRRVSVPEMQAVKVPLSTQPPPTNDPAAQLRLAKARASQRDFASADRILKEGVPVAARDAEGYAFAAWVRANLVADLAPILADLDARVAANPTCQHTLYYRGLVLKSAGELKAALRDFVKLLQQNPQHGPALLEVKELRGLGGL
jgi:tetratricopeptide (TPR) repeat protein